MLQVENLSDETILFPDDFGLKIKRWDGESWVDILNNFYYSGVKVLPTQKDYPLGELVSSLPNIPDISSQTEIRVQIVGHPENNDNEFVGAYLDVIIEP